MGDLRVELYGNLVGHLVLAGRTFDFRTDRSAFEHYAAQSTILSVSVPLSIVESRGRAARRRAYFTELLPEGRILSDLARRAGVPETDVPGFLTHYGRDVAGAVQIWDPDRPGEPRTPRVTPLTTGDVGMLLRNTRSTPLGNVPGSGKSSLAGVQEKVVLARVGDQWCRVHDGYPSTHIVKPETAEHSSLVYDEEYGTRIARCVGVLSHAAWIEDFPGRSGLVIERYDRDPDAPQGRVHQEDMNQVLGALGNQKYQEYGGRVSLARIASELSRTAGDTSVEELLRQVVVAVAIGNLDMHAKNISLLHLPDETAKLAPAYDVVPLRHHPADGRLALAVNREYVHATMTAEDIVAEASGWGVAGPDVMVATTLEAVRDAVDNEQPHPKAHPEMRDRIAGFIANLLKGDPAG